MHSDWAPTCPWHWMLPPPTPPNIRLRPPHLHFENWECWKLVFLRMIVSFMPIASLTVFHFNFSLQHVLFPNMKGNSHFLSICTWTWLANKPDLIVVFLTKSLSRQSWYCHHSMLSEEGSFLCFSPIFYSNRKKKKPKLGLALLSAQHFWSMLVSIQKQSKAFLGKDTCFVKMKASQRSPTVKLSDLSIDKQMPCERERWQFRNVTEKHLIFWQMLSLMSTRARWSVLSSVKLAVKCQINWLSEQKRYRQISEWQLGLGIKVQATVCLSLLVPVIFLFFVVLEGGHQTSKPSSEKVLLMANRQRTG